MLGFIKKDLIMIKSNFKSLGIILVVYLVMAILGDMDISFILPFMSVMLMISTFSYDSFNKWDAYALTLPNGRRNSVKAKYLVTILVILLATILTAILSFIISLNNKNFSIQTMLPTLVGTIIGTLLIEIVMYPVIYKYGVEKARFIIIFIIFGIALAGGLIISFINNYNLLKYISFLKNYWVFIVIILTILFMYLSYRISLKIQLKKEY